MSIKKIRPAWTCGTPCLQWGGGIKPPLRKTLYRPDHTYQYLCDATFEIFNVLFIYSSVLRITVSTYLRNCSLSHVFVMRPVQNYPAGGGIVPKRDKIMPAPAVTNSQNCTVKCNWRAELEHKFNSFSVGKLFRYGAVKSNCKIYSGGLSLQSHRAIIR